MLVNGKHLLDILHNYCTNWLKVISSQERIFRRLLKIHHVELALELASLRFAKLNLEYQNMGKRTHEHICFFFLETICSKSASCNRIKHLFQ